MSSYVLSALARTDLEEIWDRVAEEKMRQGSATQPWALVRNAFGVALAPPEADAAEREAGGAGFSRLGIAEPGALSPRRAAACKRPW